MANLSQLRKCVYSLDWQIMLTTRALSLLATIWATDTPWVQSVSCGKLCSYLLDRQEKKCCLIVPLLHPKVLLTRAPNAPAMRPPNSIAPFISSQFEDLLNDSLPYQNTNSNPMTNWPLLGTWYFWLFSMLFLMGIMSMCEFWRQHKSYESSSSQTLSYTGMLRSSTPSETTPVYGPPMPFIPPAAYPAPPPYVQATRNSYDTLDHRQLYEAFLSGRSAYDFYDRRHPNAYYDQYFLPDDTSSSETTSLLSYVHRSCSNHLHRHTLRKCFDKPPPYAEVTAKPELYPVVMVNGASVAPNALPHIKTSKSKCELPTHPNSWMPHTHRRNRSVSGFVPSREHAQVNNYALANQNLAEWWQHRRETVSPAALLHSCSGMPSPASSAGPLPSDVSSLAPTSPPSPPAPTSPTHNTLFPSSSSRELKDVLHKINQLPRSCTPSSPGGLSSEGNSPGGMLSPVVLTPGPSPGHSPRSKSYHHFSFHLPTIKQEPNTSKTKDFSRKTVKKPLLASLSMEDPVQRPKSLLIKAMPHNINLSSTSTPNLWVSSQSVEDFDWMEENSRHNKKDWTIGQAV